MPKESYDTDVKRKVIEKQKHLIRDFLIRRHKKKPEELRVAFFPGAEALEYKLAYEPLGILQENITAIERYKPNFEYWKTNSSFNMTDKPIDAHDFFKNYNGEPFDVISLDYDGMLNFEIEDTLDYLAGKESLSEKGVFAINLYAKRENSTVKRQYYDSLKGLEIGLMANPYWDDHFDRFNFLDQKNRGISRDTLGKIISGDANAIQTRDLGITLAILSGFGGGRALIEVPPMYKRSPNFKRRDDEVTKTIKEISIEKDFEMFSYEKMRAMLHFGKVHSNPDFLNELNEYLDKKGYIPLTSFILYAMDCKAYHLQEINSFKYVSENGATMFTDLLALDQRKDILKKYQELYDTVFTSNCKDGMGTIGHALIIRQTGQQRAFMQSYKAYQKRLMKDIKNLSPRNKKCDYRNFPPRVDLGSSQKPSIRSKKRLRELVQQGLSKEEIENQYKISDSVQGSLPAFIAHRTMDTYKTPEPKPQPKPAKSISPKKIVSKINHYDCLSLIQKKEYMSLNHDGKISKNMHLRINYFLQDTRNLSDTKKKNLYESILETHWFKDLNRGVSDLEVYAFFDDVMLNFVHQNKHIRPEKIRSLWDKIMNSETLYETRRLPESKPIKIKNKLKEQRLTEQKNQEIYDYISAGFPDEEIIETCNITKKQLGARKAWITMRGLPEKQVDKQENLEPIYADLLEGMSDEEVMTKYNIPKTKLAGKKMVLTKRGMW